ncbi:MAG: SulP family inorganic anion transporter [Thermomicrobiales bacterium]
MANGPKTEPPGKRAGPSLRARILHSAALEGVLAGFSRRTFRSDLLVGLTVSALVVPQSMAYAEIAGLPPQAGVFVSFAAPLAYALLGTSRQLICGPSSATAAISAAHVATLVAVASPEYATLSAALAVLCGLIFVVLGLLRLGFITQYISSSVQIGFLFGLGLTVIAGQIITMLGLKRGPGQIIDQLGAASRSLDDINWWSLGTGVAALLLVLALARWFPAVPAALTVVVLSIVLSTVLNLAGHGVEVIGHLDRTIPSLAIPVVAPSDWLALLPGAFAIVFIGSSESMTIARRYATLHRYTISPNQEFLALGVSGIASGLFHGFATSGGASQSAANDRAGAQTKLVSLVVSAVALLTAVALLPYIANLPRAVLAAIVVNAMRGFISLPALDKIRRVNTRDFAFALIALGAVLAFGILTGLVIAVGLSVALLLVQFSRLPVTELGALPGSSAFVSVARHPEASRPPGLLSVRPEGALLFINADWVRDTIRMHAEGASSAPNVIAIDLEESPGLDYTAAEAIAAMRQAAGDAGQELWLTNVHTAVAESLRQAGMMNEGVAQWVFTNHQDAVAAFAQRAAHPAAGHGDRPAQAS